MPDNDTPFGHRSDHVLSEDTIFSILSNQRRRYVLRYLRQVDRETDLSDLVERIAAWENDVDVPAVTYEQRKRVYTSLHQTHLPKLDDAGIVDYDRDRGTIVAADAAADLEAYLSAVDDRRQWSRIYLGLSALCLALLVAAWLDAGPFTVIRDLWLAAGALVTFAVTAVVHARSSQNGVVDDSE